MFVAQAHSFAQQARLAATLAWVAGYTNVLTILTCSTVTSHVSGTVSNLGRDLAEGQWILAFLSAFLVFSFLVGAALAGFTTELGRRRGSESIYVLPMAIEAFLLTMFALTIEVNDHQPAPGSTAMFLIVGLASVAMGLQNATITRISRGEVRTTHMTGIVTDLGLELTQFLWWIRDKSRDIPPGSPLELARSLHTHPTLRRLTLLSGIVLLFCFGAGLGTIAYAKIPHWAMFPPVLFLIWIIVQDVCRPIAEIEAWEDREGWNLPDVIAVYHLRKDRERNGKVHRMPNLQVWADRLPEKVRIVVLDIDEVKQLDANAALEIRAVLTRLASQRRRLIVAGIGGEQYEQMRRAGAGELLDPQNVCPDFELAIARALSLVHDPSLAKPTPAPAGPPAGAPHPAR